MPNSDANAVSDRRSFSFDRPLPGCPCGYIVYHRPQVPSELQRAAKIDKCLENAAVKFAYGAAVGALAAAVLFRAQ